MKSIVVVGVGNILFMDEGIGIYAARYLEENYEYSSNIEIIDGGTLGFKLMSYYQDYDKVIIIDTVSVEDAPGSIYNLPADELLGLGSYKQTAHEVEVVEMLEICSMLEKMADVVIIGMVPEDIEQVRIDLTTCIKERFNHLIAEIVKEIQKVEPEITYRPKYSLEQIIQIYENPTVDKEYKC